MTPDKAPAPGLRSNPLEPLAPGESPALRQESGPRPHHAEISRVVTAIKAIPNFDVTAPVEEYQYASLGHCVLDAIFSIGVRYEGVRAAIKRYCAHYELQELYNGDWPPPGEIPLSVLVDQISEVGPERFAAEIVQNRQRTSSKSGILKAEASLLFATVLVRHGVETFEDAMHHIDDMALHQDLKRVPGQASGISIRYFFMLAGSPDLIKPDRMITRFLSVALGREVTNAQAVSLLQGAVAQLRGAGLRADARSVDNAIWQHQRAPAAY